MTFSERLSEALAAVQPMLGLHNGGLELVSANEASGRVEIRLTGNCAQCSLSSLTLREGVERFVCTRVPEVREIIAV